jgi:16S rRNA (guanine966-N2)-methyltransferase
MRIIGGQWRSRKLDWPAHGVTRPITDRVRESLFDMLGARYGTPGLLPEVSVADVFAGGGSLGIEALSRGARAACFFERDRKALRVLRANLDRLAAGPEAMIVGVDLWRCGVVPPPAHRPLELIFIDPPFPDTHDGKRSSKLAALLRRLGASGCVSSDALVVLRTERRWEPADALGQYWTCVDSRRYGRNVLDLCEFQPTDADA